MKYLILALILILSSCHRSWIECRTEFLYPNYLASEKIDTPDPARACFFGQQILVHWRLPPSSLRCPIFLVLNIRYGNKEIEKMEIPVTTTRGWWIFRLLNQKYSEKEGILSFKAELIQEGELLDSWTHFLWADLITIPH